MNNAVMKTLEALIFLNGEEYLLPFSKLSRRRPEQKQSDINKVAKGLHKD